VHYIVPNAVGKMTTKVYTEVVLPLLKEDLWKNNLTLCHNADSAHTSRATEKYCSDTQIHVITLPGVSPDFSVFKAAAHPIKRKFHAKHCMGEGCNS
jgi:hypothetical protein